MQQRPLTFDIFLLHRQSANKIVDVTCCDLQPTEGLTRPSQPLLCNKALSTDGEQRLQVEIIYKSWALPTTKHLTLKITAWKQPTKLTGKLKHMIRVQESQSYECGGEEEAEDVAGKRNILLDHWFATADVRATLQKYFFLSQKRFFFG